MNAETILDERIDKGVAWLNANVPDWLDRIDLDRLDLASGCRCVLGQLFAHVVDELGTEDGFTAVWQSDSTLVPHLTSKETETHGFDLATNDEGYMALTEAWHDRIEALRETRTGASA